MPRAANYSILGYYYQLDKTILELLQLRTKTETVVFEGIEDVDVNGEISDTSIQVKYHSTQRFTDSGVREPVTALLKNYLTNPSRNYTLHTYFLEKQVDRAYFDIERLKKILTYRTQGITKETHVDLGCDEATLEGFLSKFNYSPGKEFSLQQNEILALLRKEFNCDKQTAELHYYPNAVSFAFHCASSPRVDERRVSKAALLRRINHRTTLFGLWLREFKGKQQYVAMIKGLLRAKKALAPAKLKALYLGKPLCQSLNAVTDLLIALKTTYAQEGRSLYNSVPWIVVLNAENDFIVDCKRLLIDEDIRFNDGWEHLHFSPKLFSAKPIVKHTPASKISETSCHVKLISSRTFEEWKDKLPGPGTFVTASDKEGIEWGDALTVSFICEDVSDVRYLLTS